MGASVKVSFVGAPSVGKSTIIKLLSGQIPPLDYKPTIGLDFGSIQFGEHEVRLWDIGGQDAFKPFWGQYLNGSYLVCVVTDSTPQNVLQSKQLVEWVNQTQKNARIIAIANKQDIDGHFQAKRVENVLQVPTYGMTAIDPQQKEKLYYILIKELLNATANEEGVE
ncbi:MAG: GTP-binding protein [Promethearchaeota archaeon]|nr:MAG: GTP-binding protein [Candidatus Lokiarchaeota archaeon]